MRSLRRKNPLIILGILVIGFLLLILYYFNDFNDNQDKKNKKVSMPKPRKILKMGESLADISWNVKISSLLKDKIDPFKIVFDTDSTGHIDGNRKTLDFLFKGKNVFTYTYQGTDLYHLIINNERWQLSFVRINDVLQENPSFFNYDRPSGIVMLDTERAD